MNTIWGGYFVSNYIFTSFRHEKSCFAFSVPSATSFSLMLSMRDFDVEYGLTSSTSESSSPPAEIWTWGARVFGHSLIADSQSWRRPDANVIFLFFCHLINQPSIGNSKKQRTSSHTPHSSYHHLPSLLEALSWIPIQWMWSEYGARSELTK